MERTVKVGELVVWHDSLGNAHNALVTAVWTPNCINVVFVSGDETKTDPYGRQIERATSCSYKDQNRVHGFYWRFVEDEPNAYVPPLER